MILSLKNAAVFCLLFLWNGFLFAQPNITRVEYYVDADPGYGIANPIPISAGINLTNLSQSINPNTLAAGVHLFGIRARDANGAWSLDNKWLFVKDTTTHAVSHIAQCEYYIDTDPGYGKANPINISGNTNFSDIHQVIPADTLATLTSGVHLFGIRARDAYGAWSLDNKWLFVKDTTTRNLPRIVLGEYYIDVDPGYGKADSINISGNTNFANIPQIIHADSLRAGVHLFGIRAKDAYGAWSLDNKWLFVKEPLPVNVPNLTRIEYYVNKDPGYGKATAINITPSANFSDTTVTLINVPATASGMDTFYLRSLNANGAWSLDIMLHPVPSSGPLPIVLVSLKGRYVNGANEIIAQIEKAINVEKIQIEKSFDGVHFTYLADIASAPVNAGSYKYDDKGQISGTTFYRLRIIDNDGSISYSYIITINHAAQPVIQIYPNPVQDMLTLHFQDMTAGNYTIRVIDLQGKDILAHKVNVSPSNQTGDVHIFLTQYAAGTYFIDVTDGSNKVVASEKIIKK